MTIYDICERLNISYEELTAAVIDIMELTGNEIHTIGLLNAMDELYEE